jgi:dimethylglycine dehydrogenase
LAVRERVGIADVSAFAKFEVAGPDAEGFLNRVCANRMPRRVGGTALTQILNRRGRIEGEATVVRLAEDRFYLVTGAPSERRIWDWIAIHERGDERITLANRTDEIGILLIAGPKARALLARCGATDLTFPWLTARHLILGEIEVLAVRLSFTGDLAWELHAPNAALGALWDLLYTAGEQYGVQPFGSFALNALRLEKGYRGGTELTNDATPIDAGLARFVKLGKDFIGKPAIEAQIRAGAAYQLVLLELMAADLDALGGEPILQDDQVVGSVSSAAYGHFVRKNLALAYLNSAKLAGSRPLSVMILGERYPAVILDEAPFDPNNERPRS